MELRLVRPTRRHRRAWYAFRQEFIQAGEASVPGSGDCKTYRSFLRKIKQFSSEKTVPESFVPSTKYFLMDETKAKIFGIVDIRHRLNDWLLNNPGGHVGYSIAPSERCKGYGTRQLALALEKCRELGISPVLITCKKSNIASARVIQKNGGALEDERLDRDGNVFQRYWIKLDNKTACVIMK